MARRDRGTPDIRLDADDEDGGGLALDTAGGSSSTGPHDGDDLDPEVTDAAGIVDFGSIRVPVPPDGTVSVEPTANGRMQAVHIALPEGRLSVSALAAPKTSKLWPELSREIDASLREGGARVRSFTGAWGRELHATSGGATSVFVGVDGARWMLYGVATGPANHAEILDAELRRMLRGTVVVRGKQPYPVRTILPLVVPDHLAESVTATPAITASGSRKRTSGKAGAGKSAPGKAAAGKTAPPKSDASTAAAKKAAARRAAARKAAAAAAVKAAAEALAEQAAEDRAAAAAAEPVSDTGSAARVAGTGAYPAPGTIPTGPGPDAPLREQAPSARRAAAAAWRSRPVAPGWEGPGPDAGHPTPPTEALPVARPADVPAVTEALPVAGAELPPTEALGLVEPASGGRRRLRDAAPAVDLPPGGRRHLQEPVPHEPRSAGRPRPLEPEPDAGGRRRLREPSADVPPATRRPPRGPDVPGAPEYPEYPDGGRRRLQEPEGAVGATAPWDPVAPDGAGGRRRLHDPGSDAGGAASGRRRLREPWDGADSGGGRQPWETGAGGPNGSVRPVDPFGAPAPASPPWDGAEPGGGRQPWETGADGLNGSARPVDPFGAPEPAPWDAGPGPGAADTGISASGRRRLREPWDEPGAPVADTGVSASGRRPVREPWEGAEPGGGPRSRDADPGGSNGSGGRRRLDERPLGLPDEDLRSAGPEPRASVADTGVSASGRRRLRESWDESGPRDAGPSGRVADTGVSASGRRRLREPWDAPEQRGGPQPSEGGPDGSGRRRRSDEPFGDFGPAGADPLYSDPLYSDPLYSDPPYAGPAPSAPAEPDVSASGRRRLREPWDEMGPGAVEPGPGRVNGTGVPEEGGRRRLEPFGESEPARREPWEEAGPGAGRVNGTGVPEVGGRRRLEPFGEPGPAGREPWDAGPGPAVDPAGSVSGRRRLREPWDGAEPREPSGPPADAERAGRRRTREFLDEAGPSAPAADTGVSASGRRRRREPWDEIGSGAGTQPAPDGLNGSGGRRRPAEPEPSGPGGRRRRETEMGEDLLSGTGGRRRRREPDPVPARDGTQTEPWLYGPDGPDGLPDRSARRTLSPEYLIATGEQDAGWATALDDYAEQRDGGRHSGVDDASPPTVRLQTLLNELDPNRPRRRHRR